MLWVSLLYYRAKDEALPSAPLAILFKVIVLVTGEHSRKSQRDLVFITRSLDLARHLLLVTRMASKRKVNTEVGLGSGSRGRRGGIGGRVTWAQSQVKSTTTFF